MMKRSMSRETMVRELANLAKLPSNTNLVRYFHCHLDEDGTTGGFRQPGRLYIVTEFINGDQLCSAVGTKHATETILGWAEGLFNGLAAMHAISMWHRDLHGGNVLIERTPASSALATGTDAIKVLDVGMARIQEENVPRAISIQGGAQSYFSRSRRAAQTFDDYDDVWAAACLLAELSARATIQHESTFGDAGVDFSMDFKDAERAAFVRRCGGSGSRLQELVGAVLLHPEADRDCKRAEQMKALAWSLARRGRS